MTEEILSRLRRCEALQRTAERRLRLLSVVLALVVGLTLLFGTALYALTSGSDARLEVEEVAVVDGQGVVRILLSGDIPDSEIDGKPVPRGDQAAGILLYDDSGRERSGYVTFSTSQTVALTLDTRERQVALFAAGPEDGVTARLWRGGDWVEMRAGATGTGLRVGRSNEIVLQEPPMTGAEVELACAELTSELEQLESPPPVEQVLVACMRHMSDEDCRSCLGIE